MPSLAVRSGRVWVPDAVGGSGNPFTVSSWLSSYRLVLGVAEGNCDLIRKCVRDGGTTFDRACTSRVTAASWRSILRHHRKVNQSGIFLCRSPVSVTAYQAETIRLILGFLCFPQATSATHGALSKSYKFLPKSALNDVIMPVRGGRIPATAPGLHGRRKTIVAFTAKFDKLKINHGSAAPLPAGHARKSSWNCCSPTARSRSVSSISGKGVCDEVRVVRGDPIVVFGGERRCSRSASGGGQYQQPASVGWFWLWRSTGVHRDGGFRWVRRL